MRSSAPDPRPSPGGRSLQPPDVTSRARWGVLLAIGVGTFMTALDGSVVNIILPVVRQQFSASVATVEWVATIYLLVLSGLLLSVGRLGDLRGHRSVYAAGFLVFLLGSALCGLSPSVGFLISARALQAVGASMLMANAPAILTKSFPAEMRGRALGLQATMTYLGLTVGPSVGGWLAAALGWRWVFYINLPVGLAALMLALRFVPRDGGRGASRAFDLRGAVAFALGLVALLLALDQGHAWGWTGPATLGLLVGSVILLLAFLRIERTVQAPLLDLSLFRQHTFSAAAGSALLNYACVYTLLFLLPFYLLQVRGLGTAQAGLLLTAQPLTMALVAPLSGGVSDRIGTRLPSVLGMGLLAVALWLLSSLAADTSAIVFAGKLGLAGLGIGIFVSPNNSALMGAAPAHRQGIAAGILALARNVGMVIGVGFAGAVYTTVLSRGATGEASAILEAMRVAYLLAAGIAVVGMGVAALRS
jgi:EmrB/QacA subfamily drug resistance transporter